MSVDGTALCGFQFGNRTQTGCLTRDDSVRLHSCEHGTKCSTLENSSKVVWITPLITRSKESNIPELGAGGGGGDLVQTHELELADPQAVQWLIELCEKHIKDAGALDLTVRLVEDALHSRNRTVDLNLLVRPLQKEAIPLETVTRLLSEVANQGDNSRNFNETPFRLIYRQGQAPIGSVFESEEDSSTHIVSNRNVETE